MSTLVSLTYKKGRLPENEQEISVEETFANFNNIVIGEHYSIDGVEV
ncbi:hypothetical protein [endosymbiont 'TC1' of Trimyema compressum]|nr:hypothetical protein [endosymbiont 'TC1' of Trimyema compressum]